MYYQNNFSPHNPQGGTSSFATSPAANINENDFGNVYFPLPPPPLPIFGGNQEDFVRNSTPEQFINKIQECTNKLTCEKQNVVTVTSELQQHICFPSLKWIARKNQSEHKFSVLPFSDINVTSVKKDFLKCSIMMKEFERLLNLLQVFKKTLSNEDWSSRCEEMKSKEEEITKLLDKYENPDYFLAVQRIIKRCVKKRLYRKRKKKEWQEKKRLSYAFREREHRRIDMWLEKMKDQVKGAQRQEQVKREADLVLSEVTAKKSEAKRFINLFNSLTKLRNARVQQSTNSISESETNSYSQVIDKLKKHWINQLNEYNMEEQGLRVMLNDAEVERVNVETKVNRQIQKKWNELLFGESTSQQQSCYANNLNELINIRYEWDRFVNTSNICLSSKIPVGWVVPSEPSNSDWSRFLQK